MRRRILFAHKIRLHWQKYNPNGWDWKKKEIHSQRWFRKKNQNSIKLNLKKNSSTNGKYLNCNGIFFVYFCCWSNSKTSHLIFHHINCFKIDWRLDYFFNRSLYMYLPQPRTLTIENSWIYVKMMMISSWSITDMSWYPLLTQLDSWWMQNKYQNLENNVITIRLTITDHP